MINLEIISVIIISLSLIYTAIIGCLSIGWFKLTQVSFDEQLPHTKLSLLVPVKNENENIKDLIHWLSELDYPQDLLEILIIDDDSTDDSLKNLQRLTSNINHITIISNRNNAGKKNALTFGVGMASGELIVTTDADCFSNRKWLKSIAAFYEKYHPKFISGPVKISPYQSLLSRFQALEFASLIGSGAGAIGLNKPIMCNGANLAYEKKAFIETGGYDGNANYSSGDDVFLMWKMQKHFGDHAVQFLKCQDAIIHTKAVSTFRQFLNQRIRWVSKSKAYTDWATIAVAIIVLLFNLSLFAGLFLSFIVPNLYIPVAMAWLVKLIVDLPLLIGITKFNKQTNLLYTYLPIQLLTVTYTLVFGVIGQFSSFTWKGNKQRR
ncbi:MAG: glycosyltransferase [Bacteroidales bacterium]|nr:glycosyltransferase [Bacteroidales bacterium]